ncbi:hypothetical protein VNO77_43021 [Canavalia gladiata]|uniref:Uncharacterized protein n=1 Tax=Canavalia gladiata TaxID=3824 RepID=A0AAN9PP01_CANGL
MKKRRRIVAVELQRWKIGVPASGWGEIGGNESQPRYRAHAERNIKNESVDIREKKGNVESVRMGKEDGRQGWVASYQCVPVCVFSLLSNIKYQHYDVLEKVRKQSFNSAFVLKKISHSLGNPQGLCDSNQLFLDQSSLHHNASKPRDYLGRTKLHSRANRCIANA